GNMGPAKLPTADSFRTGDGWLLMTALTQAQFVNICRTIGREDLPDDPRFADNAARQANAATLKAEIEAAFAGASAHEWAERLSRNGVPASAINTIPQVLEHPQLPHRSLIQTVPGGPAGLDAAMPIVTAGFGADAGAPALDCPPPRLGE